MSVRRPRAGLFILRIEMLEPSVKRTVAFVDRQNLYHAAREAFGYTEPNYDVLGLAAAIALQQGWDLTETRFYTGIHTRMGNADWHRYWTAKLAVMGRQGVKVYSRPLRYRNRRVLLPDGSRFAFLTAVEKGIDVRLALDVIRQAINNQYDVALIFSQDQDLSEVAAEIRTIAAERNRWIKIVSAYPVSPTTRNTRGIDRTDWIQIDRVTYDACLDSRNYRRPNAP